MRTHTEYATALKNAYWLYMGSPGVGNATTNIDGVAVRFTPQGAIVCRNGQPVCNYGSTDWAAIGIELQYQVAITL